MGNAPICGSCRKELSKSTYSYTQTVTVCGDRVTVTNHNHSEYYSTSKSNVAANVALTVMFPAFGWAINAQDHTYVCYDCFWREHNAQEQRRQQEQRRRQQERRRKMMQRQQELRRQEEERRRQERRRKLEEQMRQEEERRRQEEHRRKLEEERRQEEERRRQEEHQRMLEEKRRRQEALRKEQEEENCKQQARVKYLREEISRQKELIKRQEEERRKQEVLKEKHDGEIRRKEALIKKQEEEKHRQEAHIKRQEEDKCRQEETLKRQEEERNRQEKQKERQNIERCRQEALIERQKEESCKRELLIAGQDKERLERQSLLNTLAEERHSQEVIIKKQEEEIHKREALIEKQEEERCRREAIIDRQEEEKCRKEVLLNTQEKERHKREAHIENQEKERYRREALIKGQEKERHRQESLEEKQKTEQCRQQALLERLKEEQCRQETLIKKQEEESNRQLALLKSQEDEKFRQEALIQSLGEEKCREEELIKRMEEEISRREELKREELRRKEVLKHIEEEMTRVKEERQRQAKAKRSTHRMMQARKSKERTEKTTFLSERVRMEQKLIELHEADRAEVQKEHEANEFNLKESHDQAEQIKARELRLKMAEREAEKGLNLKKSKCSPREFAMWKNNRERISLCSQFLDTKYCSEEAHKHATNDSSLKHDHIFDSQYTDYTLIHESRALHTEMYIRKLIKKLIHMNIAIKSYSRQQLMSMQTTIFFYLVHKLPIENAQKDILLEQLSHVASMLDNQECTKLTIALAFFYASSAEHTNALTLYKDNMIGFFFRGIVYGCRKKCIFNGACVTQCLHKYLQSCIEGEHYDQQILQMMSSTVDTSLWCVFEEVDHAISNQCSVDLQLLKQKLHYILTYNVPLLKCNADLSELIQYKDGEDRGWKMLQHEFLCLNPQKEKLWKEIEEYLTQLRHLDRSEESCDEYLKCKRSATVEALHRIQGTLNPNDIPLAMKYLCYAVYKFTNFKILPRKTQMMTVCLLLLSNAKKVNRLLEVSTGEGKSWIIAMFAAALGMQGKKVDIITSSPVLARRDAKAFTEFYRLFDLSVAHNTETPDMLKLSDKEANDKRAECYKKTIVYGTVGSFSADILREEFEMKKVRCNRGFKAAIVDEVDMLMLDEGVQFTYLSHRAAVLRHVEPVLALVWSTVSQHTPLVTMDGEILYAGVPKSFHKTIFDNVEKSEDGPEDPAQLLEFLIETNTEGDQNLPALQMLLDSDNAESEKQALVQISSEDIVTYIQQMNRACTFHVVPYILEEEGALQIVGGANVKTDELTTTTTSVLVAGEGILYPLYTQEKLSQGIESMTRYQCDLPNVNNSSTYQHSPVLRSSDDHVFVREEPCPHDTYISNTLDAEEILSSLISHISKQNTSSATKTLEKCNDFTNGDLPFEQIVYFLQQLEKRVETGFPALYCINSENQLVRQVTNRNESASLSDSGVLITPEGVLYQLISSENSTAKSTGPATDDMLLTSDGEVFTRGERDSLHNIVFQFVRPLQLLSMLLGEEKRERLNQAVSNPSLESTLDVIDSVKEHLTCNVVVYCALNEKEICKRESVMCSKKQLEKKPADVSILVMTDGKICELQPKETVFLPEFLKQFVANQLPTYINSAFTALQMRENREYVLKGDENGAMEIAPVDFLNSGVIEESKKWGGGLQQMLEMKHNFQISSMSVVTNFMSHVEFFRRYTDEKGLYGLSGTVGGVKDAEILKQLYQLHICKIPTYRQSLRYEKDPVFVQGEKHEWYEQIYMVLIEATNPKSYAKHLHGAAALVLCEDIHTAKEIFSFLKGRVQKELILYDGEDSQISIEEAPKDSGDIIVATNLAGRGTDIPVTSEVNDSGGLFCLMTFLPRNRRVELQAFGRTARRGNPGVVQYVLHTASLPCKYSEGLDIATVRELKAKEETQRLQHMLETDIKAVDVRERLFRNYCQFLQTVHRNIEHNKEKQIILDTINESWGQWLQMKQHDIGVVPLQNLLRELRDNQREWHRPQTHSPELPRNISYHHLVKFANEMLGVKRLPDDKKVAEKAMKYYRQAISLESRFSVIAHYNYACCYLHTQEKDIESGRKELEKARKQLQVLMDEVSLILQCTQTSRQSRASCSESSYLLKQMEVRMQVLQFFRNQIDETVEKLEQFEKKEAKIKVVPSSILDLIPEADLATNEELYGLSQLGLEFAFTVEEKPRFCWEGLAVFALGLLQIAAGVCICALTAGASSQLGMGLISEGVSDCIDGIVGMATGKWDWKEWAISKAVSIGVTIVSGGVSKFISMGAKAVKGAKVAKSASKAAKGMKKITSAAKKVKGVAKDLKGMARVAKDSWGKALKTNIKNAAKLAGKEMLKQGVMYAVSELEDRAMNCIFKKMGEMIASSIAPSVEQSFLESNFEEKQLGLVINLTFISKVSSSYAEKNKLDPALRSEAKQYFSSCADRVVYIVVPSSGTFQEIAERVRSILPQISESVKGTKAAAVMKVIELGFVADSLRKVEPQLRNVASKFVPELTKLCLESMQWDITEDEYKADDRYSLSCVADFKKELAKHAVDKLAEATTLVLQQNLKWMATRALSATVNKFASEKLHKALNVDGTKKLLEAGQKANHLRSAKVGVSPTENVDAKAINSHCDKLMNPETPGTLSEARIVAETYGCKVTIEDDKGKRVCSMSSSKGGKLPKVTLVHIPPNKDHPSGHYKVKIDGKAVDVKSSNKNCMFESLAHGLSHLQHEESKHLTGLALREKVAKQIKDNPHMWSEHAARKEELMKIKEHHDFLLTGGEQRKWKTAEIRDSQCAKRVKKREGQHVDHNFELQQLTHEMAKFDLDQKHAQELKQVMNHHTNLAGLNARSNRQKGTHVRRALLNDRCDSEQQRRALRKTVENSRKLLATAKQMGVSKQSQDVLKSALANTRRIMKKKINN